MKKRPLDPCQVAQNQDIPSKIRLGGIDSNRYPPIRDTEEWLKILVELRAWMKEAAAHARP